MDTFYGPIHAAKNKMTLRLNFAEVSTAWRAVDIMSLLIIMGEHSVRYVLYHEIMFYCPLPLLEMQTNLCELLGPSPC